MQEWLSIVLAWCVVPVTLFIFWGRFLLRHDWFGTGLHVGLLAASIGGGWISYRLARATLRGEPRKPFVWAQAWKDARTYKRIAGVFATCALGVILYLVSVDAIEGVPSYIYAGAGPRDYLKRAGQGLGVNSLQRVVPRSLENIGFRPSANLGGQEISTKPPNWTGDVKDYGLVKGAHLPQANMQYAIVGRAFLVNAEMGMANLSNAELTGANLSNAQLLRVDLSNANLNVADLSKANLWEAKLPFTILAYAKLPHAILMYVDLSDADLTGANLLEASLSRACLLNAKLSGANLSDADLSDADLSGANLSDAHVADAQLSKANLNDAYLEGVDLRNAQGLTNSQLKTAKTDEHTLLPADLSP